MSQNAVSAVVSTPWSPRVSAIARSVAAVAAGLAVCLVIILIVSDEPADAFLALTLGSFRDPFSFGSMLSIATILVVTGLAAAVAFRAGAFNIGGEGQLYLGAVAAAIVALSLPVPGPLVIVIAIVAGALAGAAWVAIPALLRAFLGVNEIVTTLMANYIAILTTLLILNLGLRDVTSGAPESSPLPLSAYLPTMLEPSKANWGLFVAIAAVVVTWVVLRYTRAGFRLRLVGLSPLFADTVGVSPQRVLATSLLVSGAIAGLAGALVTLGIEHRFIQGFSPGYGFLGITVALIGRLDPFGVLAAGVLYGMLLNGATKMQSASDVPFALVFLLQGVIILLITAQRLGLPRSAVR